MTRPVRGVEEVMTTPSPATPYTGDAAVVLDDDLTPFHELEGEGFDLEERQALRRVAGIRTDLEDVTEVEYRQLRLERVVLIGVWTGGDVVDAENSLRELAALAETAGAEVLEGLMQRRVKPGPAADGGSGEGEEVRGGGGGAGAGTGSCGGGRAPRERAKPGGR